MNRFKPQGGGFAEYALLDNVLALKIPDHMSFEEAATLGTALASALMTLFWALKWPISIMDQDKRDDTPRVPVLVYGGSTSTGTMMLQFLK